MTGRQTPLVLHITLSAIEIGAATSQMSAALLPRERALGCVAVMRGSDGHRRGGYISSSCQVIHDMARMYVHVKYLSSTMRDEPAPEGTSSWMGGIAHISRGARTGDATLPSSRPPA